MKAEKQGKSATGSFAYYCAFPLFLSMRCKAGVLFNLIDEKMLREELMDTEEKLQFYRGIHVILDEAKSRAYEAADNIMT